MARHVFEPTHFHRTIGEHEPVLHVAPGDSIATWCVDGLGFDAQDRRLSEAGNPQTGPFFVEGAEPGDVLAVSLDRLRPNRGRAVSGTVVAEPVVDPSFVRRLPEPGDAMDTWTVDVEHGTATLDAPPAGLEYLGSVAIDPMLGCFGVAPGRGQAISCATSGRHGGNMDYRGFREGVTVYFPVFVEGALLHLGDGHALQGDGEIVGTGIEISLDVEVTVDVIKGKDAGWPRADDGDHLMAVGNARPLDQAVQHATTELMRWLADDYGLDHRASSALLGQLIRYDLGNVFDPAYTMVARIAKRHLPELAA
jgi:acetamidase/formamidase